MSAASATDRPATEVRAYHVRTALQILAEADPALHARVRHRLGPEALALVEDSARLAWIPGLVDVTFWRALHDAQGGAGVVRAHGSLLFCVGEIGRERMRLDQGINAFLMGRWLLLSSASRFPILKDLGRSPNTPHNISRKFCNFRRNPIHGSAIS